MGFFVAVAIVVAAIYFLASAIRVVRQAQVIVIEKLGAYHKTLRPGLNFINPFFDRPKELAVKKLVRGLNGEVYPTFTMSTVIDLRESVFDFPRQNVITKDNVTIGINALLYYQVVDPKRAVYEIENLPEAIEKLTQTSLRNVVGEMDLDATLVSREIINTKLRQILDEATNKWGVKVNRVELQDIIPPKEIQNSMEKQMKAERDKRAAILESEGLKRSAILQAEGIQESQIRKAEGEKQAAILIADGKAQARVKEAQGEANAIRQVIEALKENGQPDKYLIAMKYLETLKGIAYGQNNKIVYMPYEATGVLSSIDGIKEMLNGAHK